MLGGYYLGQQVLGGGTPVIIIIGGTSLVAGTGLIVVAGGTVERIGGTVSVSAIGLITVNNSVTYYTNIPVARVPFTVTR